MALTRKQMKRASKYWLRSFYSGRDAVAVSLTEIGAAVNDVNDWLEAAPAGGPSNKAALRAVIDSGFKTLITGASQNLAVAQELLVAAVSKLRAEILIG